MHFDLQATVPALLSTGQALTFDHIVGQVAESLRSDIRLTLNELVAKGKSDVVSAAGIIRGVIRRSKRKELRPWIERLSHGGEAKELSGRELVNRAPCRRDSELDATRPGRSPAANRKPDSDVRNSLSTIGSFEHQGIIGALTFSAFPIERSN
jgi:hypothetical protein